MDVPDKPPSGFLTWEPISISPFWQVCHRHDDETVVSAPLHLAFRQFPSSAIMAVKQFAHVDSFGGWGAGTKNLSSSGKFQCFLFSYVPLKGKKKKATVEQVTLFFPSAPSDLNAERESTGRCSLRPVYWLTESRRAGTFVGTTLLSVPLLRLTQDPCSFPLGSFIHTTLLEIWDLRINTSSSPASLLTFNIIAESLFQCCVAQELVKWQEGQHRLAWAENCKGIPVVLLVFLAIASAEEH